MIAEGGGGGSQPIQSGNGSPVWSVVPTGKGYLYLDLSAGAAYVAVGVTNADWSQLGGVSATGAGPGVAQPGGIASAVINVTVGVSSISSPFVVRAAFPSDQ